MKKLMITCLMLLTIVFMWGCKSVQPTPRMQDPDFDKIKIMHKGEVISVIDMKTFIKICYNSILIEQMITAEESGKLYYSVDDSGLVILVWENEEGVIIKELKIKL